MSDERFEKLASQLGRFQALLHQAGNAPNLEARLLYCLAEAMLPDDSDEAKRRYRTEIYNYLEVDIPDRSNSDGEDDDES